MEEYFDLRKKKDGFRVDVEDPRFQKIFDKAEYVIDPTHEKYKETQAIEELRVDMTRRRSAKKERKT